MLITPASSLPRTLEELLPPGLASKIDRLDIFSRRVFAGKLPGERRSKRRGRSVEFDDFRPYVAGDDLRHIDWNIYGRFERLIMKLFREEEDLALHLILDASASMGAGSESARGGGEEVPTKSLYAHRLAMALAYVGLVKNNRVSVASFGGAGGTNMLRAVRGRSSLRRISDFLLGSLRSGSGAPDFNSDLRSIAARLSGRGVVVVISDLLAMDGVAGGIAAIGAAEHGALDAYCLHVLAPSELDPGRSAAQGLTGDLRLTDVETARGREVTVSPAAIAQYRKNAGAFVEGCRAACRARGVAHFLVPTDTPIDRLVIDSLRRGGMMR